MSVASHDMTGPVKSAARVFEVLELFRERAQALKTVEITAALGYPKSSTAAILKSLLDLGYLSYDRKQRRYFPTLRVTMLGEWLPQHLSDVPDVARLMDKLQEQTGETITLTMRNGFSMQVLRLRQSTHAIALNVSEGFRIPLFTSAVGQAFLATQRDDVVQSLVSQYNSAPAREGRRIDVDTLFNALEQVRTDGISIAYDQALSDTGAVALALPSPTNQVPLVVAVAGLAARMHERETRIVKTLKRQVAAL